MGSNVRTGSIPVSSTSIINPQNCFYMKRPSYLLLMTAVILAFAVSCKKQEQEVAAASSIEFVLEDNILSVAAEGGDFVVSYNIVDPVEGGKVSASVDKDWVENLNYETAGKIAFHLGENDGEDSRSALVTVAYTAEDGTVVDEAEFTVEQAAAGQEEPEPEIVKVELTDYLAESTSYYPGESVDNFYLSLYTGEVELYESEEGSIYVPADAESQLLHLDLYCRPVADGGELVLPEGTYTVADNMDAGSAYGYYTFAIRYFDDGMLGYADPVEGGTVVVEHTEDGYSITASFEMVRMDDGASLGRCEYTYGGPLAFLDMSEPEPPTQEEMYPPLTESINTVFTGCDIRYLGVPAYSSPIDCYVIDLFDDPTPGEDGSLDEGNVLRLELYTEHQWWYPGETGVKMPGGTYDMTDGYVPVEPGIGTGDLWDSGYGFFPFGSYVRHLDEEDGIVRYGFLSEEGQVVIESDDAGSYVITVNVTTRDGFTVSGTYSGKVDIINEASEPERSVQSRIYEDKVLDLSNTTSADVDFYGTEKNDMTHYYQIFAQDPVSRQGFQLQLLAPAGETGALAGVYKPAESLMPDKLLPYTYIIGDIQLVSGGAAMIGTWGYYETNEDGRAVAFAPAMFGDITITESETTPGQFIIDYVLTDDNLDEPHTMTAHFTGTFDITDHTESASAAEYLPLPAGNDVRRAPVVAPEGRRLRCEEVLKAVRR